MARTLTAGATTWKAGQGYVYDWLVESADLGLRLSYSEESAGGYTWEHRLISISEIEQSIPPGGGLGSAQTVSIMVAEDGAGQSLRALWNDLGKLDGADLSVSLLPDGETYANKIVIFTGIIDGVSWSTGTGPRGGIATLTASDQSIQVDVLLPSERFTAATFPNIPARIRELVVPLLYGISTANTDPVAPMFPIDAATLTVFQVASNVQAMAASVSIATATGSQLISLSLDPGQVDVGNARVTLDNPLTETEFSAGTPSRAISRQVNTSNATSAIDGDTGTVAEIATSSVDIYGDGYGALGISTGIDATGVNAIRLGLKQHKRKTGGATTTYATLRLRSIDASGNVVRDNLYVSGDFRFVSNPRNFEIALPNQIAVESTHDLEAILEVINEGGTGGANDAWQVGEIELTAYYQPQSPYEQIYLNGWTGIADPTVSADAFGRVYLAADVIRHILVVHMGLAVNTTAFGNARTGIQTYNSNDYTFLMGLGSGGWLHEQILAVNLLDDLCRQSMSYIFPDGTGSVTIVPYDAAASSQYSFTTADIFNLRVDISRPELITTSFEVKYRWEPNTQRFSRRSYASQNGTNHADGTIATEIQDRCTDAFIRYGERRQLVIPGYAITDQEAADTLLEHLVTYFSSQLIVAEFETTFVGVHLQVGDFITITHPEMTANESGQTFEIVRLRYVPEIQGTRPPPIRITAVRPNRVEMTYFAIKDQGGTTWYWWINSANELAWDTSPPSFVTRFETDIALSPTPSWLEIDDPNPTTRYVYPLLTGEPFVGTSAPASGTGYVGSPTMRGVSFPLTDWEIIVTLMLEVDVQTV